MNSIRVFGLFGAREQGSNMAEAAADCSEDQELAETCKFNAFYFKIV